MVVFIQPDRPIGVLHDTALGVTYGTGRYQPVVCDKQQRRTAEHGQMREPRVGRYHEPSGQHRLDRSVQLLESGAPAANAPGMSARRVQKGQFLSEP